VFEHFTESARRVLVLAQEDARQLHVGPIEPVDLLLGMLREGEGVAAKALSETGADYFFVRDFVETADGQRLGRGSGPQPFSEAAMRIIERSVGISWARANGGVDTEHLLAAVLEQEDETVEAVMAELDVTPQEVMLRAESISAERALLADPRWDPRLPDALGLALGADRRQRLEVLEGVLWAIDHLDEVVELMRTSANRRAARDVLMAPPYEMSQNQATSVLDLSVLSVTVERRKEIIEEIEVLRLEISDD